MSEHGAPSPARPPVVTAAAVVLFVVAGINLVSSFFLFGVGTTLGVVFGLISLAVAAAAAYAGVQILALRAIGRAIGLAVAGLGIAIDIYILIAEANFFAIVGLALYGFVVWALMANAELFQPST